MHIMRYIRKYLKVEHTVFQRCHFNHSKILLNSIQPDSMLSMFLDFKGHFNVRTICIYSFIFCWSRIVENNNDSNRMGYNDRKTGKEVRNFSRREGMFATRDERNILGPGGGKYPLNPPAPESLEISHIRKFLIS